MSVMEKETADLTGDELAEMLAKVVPTAGAWDRLTTDRESLSDRGLMDAIMALERLFRHVQGLGVWLWALSQSRHAQAPPGEAGELKRCADAETLAALLHLDTGQVERRLALAALLATRYPRTVLLLQRGEIHFEQAKRLASITACLSDETAREVETRVLPYLPGQRLSATDKLIRRAVMLLDSEGEYKRHQAEKQQRKLVLRPRAAGMASLDLYTTAENAAALMAAVDAVAKKKTPAGVEGARQDEGDERTLDQRRADALTDLVLRPTLVRDGAVGSDPSVRNVGESGAALFPSAVLHVLVDYKTLIGMDERPAELIGTGPIHPVTARALAFAPGSIWRRMIINSDTGGLIAADPHVYRPNASTDRFVRARDRYCTFPGCTRPAEDCDLDHVDEFNHRDPGRGGPTHECNLQPLCRHHHRLKTMGLWTVHRDHATGQTIWTSRTGHQIIVPSIDQREVA